MFLASVSHEQKFTYLQRNYQKKNEEKFSVDFKWFLWRTMNLKWKWAILFFFSLSSHNRKYISAPHRKFNSISDMILFFSLWCPVLFGNQKLSTNKQWLEARFPLTLVWSNGCIMLVLFFLPIVSIFSVWSQQKIPWRRIDVMWMMLKMRREQMWVCVFVCENNYLWHVRTVSCNSHTYTPRHLMYYKRWDDALFPF